MAGRGTACVATSPEATSLATARLLQPGSKQVPSKENAVQPLNRPGKIAMVPPAFVVLDANWAAKYETPVKSPMSVVRKLKTLEFPGEEGLKTL